MTIAPSPVALTPIALTPIASCPVALDPVAVGVQLSLLLVVKIFNKLGNKLLEIAFLCICCVQHLLMVSITLRMKIIKKMI